MEFNQVTDSPRVRIGVLQHEDEMTFRATGGFVGFDLNGKKVFEGKKEYDYKNTHDTSDAGEIR